MAALIDSKCLCVSVGVGVIVWVKVDVCGWFCECSYVGGNGDFHACVSCVHVEFAASFTCKCLLLQ